jgi:hypothetical protein
VQRHGIGQRGQQPSSGSIPHDRVTLRQICSSRSPPLHRPRPSAFNYPPVVANRPTIYGPRRHPPRTRQPPHRRTTCRTGSIHISQLARGTQIPIAPAAPLHVPLRAVSSLGGFRTPAAEYAALSLKRPASETLHRLGHSAILARCPVCPKANIGPALAFQRVHVRYRMTTNVPAPVKAVRPMENRTLKSSARLVLKWRSPLFVCQTGAFANWQDSATLQ